MEPDRSSARVVDRAIRHLAAALDEKQRRRFAGLLAVERGRGGVTRIASLIGMSRTTVLKGVREVLLGGDRHPGRIRGPGGGRKPAPKKTRA